MTVVVTIDRTAPTISITPANGEVLNTATPLIQVHYSDALCGIQTASLNVKINGIDRTSLFTAGASEATCQLSEENALPPGENVIIAKIADKAGNEASITSTFTVETTPPGPPAQLGIPEGELSTITIPDDPESSVDLKALVTDANGKGVPQIAVFFQIVEGTGTIGSTSTTKITNSQGIATATYHPDNQAGNVVIRMTLPDYPQIEAQQYTISKQYYIKPVIEIVSGNNQTGTIGRCLAQPLKVKITDSNHSNTPLQGMEVEFEVTSGFAVLSKAQDVGAISDATGIAGTALILGRTPDQPAQIKASIVLRHTQEVSFIAIGKKPIFQIIQGDWQYSSSPLIERWRGTEVTPLIQGWLPGSGLYESFGVIVVDYQGCPLPDVEVKFERAPIVPGSPLPSGIILPERVVTTNWAGMAFSGLIMDVAGEQKVIASLPEFQSIAPLEFKAQCNNLADLVTPYNPDDLYEILERALPLISIVKMGNGQIGANGKKLSVNLTAEMRNRFGEVPITPGEASALIKAWYDRHWSGKEIVITGVQVIMEMNAYFEVMEGNAALQKPATLPLITKSATQQKLANENVLEIKCNIVVKNPKEKAQVKQKTTQVKATTSNIIYYPIGNQGAYDAELVFGENLINPVTVHAAALGYCTVRLTFIDHDPQGGMTIDDVPRANYDYSLMPTYFFIGPPEVRLVDSDSFSELNAIHSFPPELAGVKKGEAVNSKYLFYSEIKLPAGMTEENIGRLISLDSCGKAVAQPQDIVSSKGDTYKHAKVLQEIAFAPTLLQPSPERYTLYRSKKTVLAIDSLLEQGTSPEEFSSFHLQYIDPTGKLKVDLGSENSPFTMKDIGGVRVNGFPSFSISGIDPLLDIIFEEDIKPETLQIVRDDGNDATEDTITLPNNLFQIDNHRIVSLTKVPQFSMGINRIVATATSKTNKNLRAESNVLLYPTQVNMPIEPSWDYAQEFLNPTAGGEFFFHGIASGNEEDEEVVTYMDEIKGPKRSMCLLFQKASCWDIIKLLRHHTLFPTFVAKMNSFVGIRKQSEEDSLLLLEKILAEPKIAIAFIPGEKQSTDEERPEPVFVPIIPSTPLQSLRQSIRQQDNASQNIEEASGQPFSGSGATGKYRRGNLESVYLTPEAEILVTNNREPFTNADIMKIAMNPSAYENPLHGTNELSYYTNLTELQRYSQVDKLLSYKINTIFPHLYKKEIPLRSTVIEKAAAKYNISPVLLAGIILAEQRDQSEKEDIADFIKGVFMAGMGKPITEVGDSSIGLGQVIAKTAKKYDLLSDIDYQRQKLVYKNRWAIAFLLTSEEVNIYATAKYLRIIADKGATVTIHPRWDLSSLKYHDKMWGSQSSGNDAFRLFENIIAEAQGKIGPGYYGTQPFQLERDALILLIGSEYTSAMWDGKIVPTWGAFVSLSSANMLQYFIPWQHVYD